jgi:hypothetical protein
MKRAKGNIFRMLCVLITAMSVLCIGIAGNAFAGVVRISAAEFTSDGMGGSYSKWFDRGTLLGDDSNPCLVARVNIPGTARSITKVVVYLTDDGSSSSHPWFSFSGLNMATGETAYGDDEVTTGTTTLQGIQIPVGWATKAGMVYQLGTCLQGGQELYGAKVVYLP